MIVDASQPERARITGPRSTYPKSSITQREQEWDAQRMVYPSNAKQVGCFHGLTVQTGRHRKRTSHGRHLAHHCNSGEAPLAFTIFIAAAVLLSVLLLAALLRTRVTAVPIEMTAVTILAILLSPIAWDHYWTLMFPAFLIVYESSGARLLGATGRFAFWIAAGLTTALSPLTLGVRGFNVARALSVDTIAALIVLGALVAMMWKARPGTEPADEATRASRAKANVA